MDRTRTTHRIEELAPDASNPQGSGRVGARVRCKTERGDRGDNKGVLTGVEDGGRRPKSEVNGGGGARAARSPGAAVLRGETGRRRVAQAG
jgi:hypothetical protein